MREIMWGLSPWDVEPYTGWGSRVISRIPEAMLPSTKNGELLRFAVIVPMGKRRCRETCAKARDQGQ